MNSILMPPSPSTSRRGSALLLTLMVVSLLMVLTLSFTVYIRMQMRSVSNHMTELAARSHARLGLELGLAELQKALGPDQRTSATAWIGTLGDGDPDTADNGIPASGPGTGAWTGVWGNAANPVNQSAPNDPSKASHEPEVPVLLTWLVSGNESARFTSSISSSSFGQVTSYPGAASSALSAAYPWIAPVPAATAPLAATPDLPVRRRDGSPPDATVRGGETLRINGRDAAVLAGPGSLGDDADGLVAAPLVDIPNPGDALPVGRYAWWAGDEGVKTRVDLTDPEPDVAGDAAHVRRLQAPRRANLSLLNPDWEADWPGLERLATHQQLLFAPGVDDLPDAGFHEFTLHSEGLLADSARGGLRKNLTAGFAASTPPAEIALDEPLFNLPADTAPSSLEIENRGSLTRVQWSGIAPAPGALPSWGMLRAYTRLADEISGDLPVVTPRAPAAGQAGIYPIATRVHLNFAAAVVNGNPYAVYMPSVVLWNPTNTRLAAADYWFNVEMNAKGITGHDYHDEFGRHVPAFLFVHGPNLATPPYFGNTNTMWNDTVYRDTHMVAGRAATDLVEASDEMASAAGHGFRFIVRCSTPLEPGEARVFSPLGQEALASDPAQRVLVDGFGENSYFHERLDLDNDIGSNHVFRAYVGVPGQVFNKPLRYSYGLGTDFSDATKLRQAEGITGSGGMAGGSITKDLRINTSRPYDQHTNPLITGASDFPQDNDDNGAGGYPVHMLASLDPNDSGGVFPPNYSPFGFDFLMQMALPERSGFSQSQYDTVYMKWMGQHNPLAPALDVNATDGQATKGYNTNPFFNMNTVGGYNPKKRVFDISPDVSSGDGTFVGGSHYLTNPAGPGALAPLELPREETGLLSIGALQYAQVHPRAGQLTDVNAYSASSMPAFPIGNALADPRVHPADIDGFPNNWRSMGHGSLSFGNPRTDGVTRRLHFDLGFLLNRALWDRYYFSSVPESGLIDLPLPNPRLRPVNPASTTLETDLRDFDRAAAELRVVGAFNVNSTSVAAWTALLTAFRNLEVAGAGPNPSLPEDVTPFPKPFRPAHGPLDNSGNRDLTYEANRFRTLDDDEIAALAASIVAEIKNRGPSLSLAGFINRRPQALSPTPSSAATLGLAVGDPNSPDAAERRVGDQALLGTIQLAMDRVASPSATTPHSVTGINDRLRTFMDTRGDTDDYNNTELQNSPHLHRMAALGFEDAYDTSTSSDLRPDAPLALRSSAVGMPGYLTQADILQSIGAVLSARSDTFRVRAYGDVRDPATGDVAARAWLEAVVRRTPDYVDPADDPVTHPADTAPANRLFGRRFELVSLHWLNADDI